MYILADLISEQPSHCKDGENGVETGSDQQSWHQSWCSAIKLFDSWFDTLLAGDVTLWVAFFVIFTAKHSFTLLNKIFTKRLPCLKHSLSCWQCRNQNKRPISYSFTWGYILIRQLFFLILFQNCAAPWECSEFSLQPKSQHGTANFSQQLASWQVVSGLTEKVLWFRKPLEGKLVLSQNKN